MGQVGMDIDQVQCEELAETLVSHYQEFYASLRYAAMLAPAQPKVNLSQTST